MTFALKMHGLGARGPGREIFQNFEGPLWDAIPEIPLSQFLIFSQNKLQLT